MKLFVIAAALGLAVSASAQTTPPASTTKTPATGQTTKSESKTTAKADADHKFITEAAQGGMAEVELGRLASQKASSDEVKKFGQKMVDDHSKANDELKSIASKKSITLPADLDKQDKALMDRLSKLSGAQFDRSYMQAMLKDHQKDVNEFMKESNAGKDADVKAFAAKTLPTLQEHLKLARDTDRTLLKSNDKSQQSATPSTSKGSQPKGANQPQSNQPKQ